MAVPKTRCRNGSEQPSQVIKTTQATPFVHLSFTTILCRLSNEVRGKMIVKDAALASFFTL